MSIEHDVLDLSLLYDTARGFLSLSSHDDVLRHALLSCIGSCGASFALWLDARADGALVPGAVRGAVAAELPSLRLDAPTARALVEEPGPYQGADVDALGADLAAMRGRHGVRLAVAIVQGEELCGLVLLGGKLLGEPYDEREAALIAEIARLAAQALRARAATSSVAPRSAKARHEASPEAVRLRYPALRRILGEGASTLALYEELVALAPFDFPVLVIGETGTGKELVARALHELGPRAAQPFEAVNCAAIPRELVASALFGHERGAFTGAVTSARGAFELAGAGTLFLDEIGDMPLDTQATLLRVLQEQRFRRVGGEKVLRAPARVVSATNVDLLAAVEASRFRADLFYRIQTYVVRLVPLRERREEIPHLVEHLLARGVPEGPDPPRASDAFLAEIARRELHGNVRELEGLVLAALVRARGAAVLLPEHLPVEAGSRGSGSPAAGFPRAAGPSPAAFAAASPPDASPGRDPEPAPETVRTYEEMERQYVRAVLKLTNGNKKRAAELMDIPRTTLNARIRKLGLDAAAS